MLLLPFFEWMAAHAPWSEAWPTVGPFFNLAHLLGMVVFSGALLMVDLRLLGGILPGRAVAQVARDAQGWLIGGFVVLVVTGIPALMNTAMGQYYSPVFWFKMQVLLAATIFTFTLRHWVSRRAEGATPRPWRTLVGLVSIALWASVAASARLIMLV